MTETPILKPAKGIPVNGLSLWNRFNDSLMSGKTVELVVPRAGRYDALKVRDYVLILPKEVELQEGTMVFVKLGPNGKLQIV
jgi:hypothetical protein